MGYSTDLLPGEVCVCLAMCVNNTYGLKHVLLYVCRIHIIHMYVC